MDFSKRLSLSLFFLRISVFLVMLMWTLDKIIRPGHAATVYKVFYFIPGVQTHMFYIIAGLELLLIFAFLFGIKKRISYGLVFILHAVSTLACYKQYLDPYHGSHLLFFAAWPMLAACFALYLLRDKDDYLTFGKA